MQFSNTWPKLLEVSCGRTSQHSKGLLNLTMSWPVQSHSPLYRVPHKVRTRTPRWSPKLWYTTSFGHPTHSGPVTCHNDEDRLTLGTSELAVDDTPVWNIELESSPLACSEIENLNLLLWHTVKYRTRIFSSGIQWNTELESSTLTRPDDTRAHEGCNSLRNPKVRSLNRPISPGPELAFGQTKNNGALTVPSGLPNWFDRRLTTQTFGQTLKNGTLTAPSGLPNWFDRRLTTQTWAQRP